LKERNRERKLPRGSDAASGKRIDYNMSVTRTLTTLSLGLVMLLVACATDDSQATTAKPSASSDTSATATIQETTEPPLSVVPEDSLSLQREVMVKKGIIGWGITNEAVIKAMGKVPRHEFVPEEFQKQAYENHPLPIGYGQTISQPYIVALMTEALDLANDDIVLEVGTGSGYQAAVLGELVDKVYTVEIIGGLTESASAAFSKLGYDNITVHHADGYFGLEEQAPFDAIIVTAAPDHIPQPLVQQLKIGGKMVIPVGPVGGFQTLWLITRVGESEVRSENLGGVRFVPLTREAR
jgi:protein-L-isoaspartate(D-aspartate) O-methyltransferase